LVREQAEGLRFVGCGVFTTPSKQPLSARLQVIYTKLSALIREYEPEVAAVEELFFSRNARTALSVGHARGVVLLALAHAGLPIFEYKPLEIKQAITGYGGADKRQVQEMVRMLLGLDQVPQPDDAADAVAVAVCHIHSARMAALLAQAG
jgi:crossover junction endodeoxyribonuclease RuvC